MSWDSEWEDDMKMESFWQSTAPTFTGECQQPLPATADVVIVGGGFSGISASRNLARQGLQVVVLESERIMSQASARNGGHCNKRYLDFVGGIGVLNVGHNPPTLTAAVKRQLSQVTHTCFQVAAYPVYISLAEHLNQLIGKNIAFQSVFFSSGAEAVENAVKIARGYTNRPGIIAFDGAFHGRTLLGTTLTGMSQPYKQNFGPFAGGIYRLPFPNEYCQITEQHCPKALDTLFAAQVSPEQVAAKIIEPVQGDGGGYLRQQVSCKHLGTLLKSTVFC